MRVGDALRIGPASPRSTPGVLTRLALRGKARPLSSRTPINARCRPHLGRLLHLTWHTGKALAYDIPSHMDQVADDLLDLLDVVRSFALQDVVLPTDAHCRETVAGLRATAERFRAAARATSDRPHEAHVLAAPSTSRDE